MSIRTRQLPTNSRTVLDELVDPNARHERSSSHERHQVPGAGPAVAPTEVAPPEVARPDFEPPFRSDFEPEVTTAASADVPWYRREKWLAVQVVAIVPILSAMLVPASYRLPLCVLGGALVAIGTVMLLRHKPTPALSRSGSADSR